MSISTPSLTLRSIFARAVAAAGLDRTVPITAGLTAVVEGACHCWLGPKPTGRDGRHHADGHRRRAARGRHPLLLWRPRGRVRRSDRASRPASARIAGRSLSRDDAAFPRRGGAGPRAPRRHLGIRPAHRRVGRRHVAPREPTRAAAARPRSSFAPGTEIEPLQLADLLVDAGFTREDPSTSTAPSPFAAASSTCFRRRPLEPVRIEFVGDMVETLRRFDPATQRSTGPTDHVQLVPGARAIRRRRAAGPDHRFHVRCTRRRALARLRAGPRSTAGDQSPRSTQNSYQEAQGRGHVVALPPEEAFVNWDALSVRASAGASPRGAGGRGRAGCARSAASRPWSSAAGSQTGSPISGRRASAARP